MQDMSNGSINQGKKFSLIYILMLLSKSGIRGQLLCKSAVLNDAKDAFLDEKHQIKLCFKTNPI